MTDILTRLKNLRAKTHALPILAVEHELDRIIHDLESQDEVSKELSSLFQGQTLTSADLKISYRLLK